MKSHINDVIMICKGHYNENFHKSTLDAIREYYMREYLMEEKHATNMNIFNALLMPIAEEYFHPRDWKEIIFDLFQTDYSNTKGFYCPADGTRDELFNRVFHKVLSKILMFQVRNEDGEWIIDLSEYSPMCEII